MNYTHPEYLISTDELDEYLPSPDLQVLDATVYLLPGEKGYRVESGKTKFVEGHIPGAQFMDLVKAFADTTSGLGFTLPGAEHLQGAIRELGINQNTRLVVYSTGHIMWATRAWWLLHHSGHRNIRVLNGGFNKWQAEKRPVVAGIASTRPNGNFTVAIRPEVFADKQQVLAAIGDPTVCTVNALPAAVHNGSASMNYGRPGHIAASGNLPFDDLLQDGCFRDADELKDRLSANHMLDAQRVITYCGGGIAATVDALACLLVGKEAVAVYDGSMSEWAADPNAPMEINA